MFLLIRSGSFQVKGRAAKLFRGASASTPEGMAATGGRKGKRGGDGAKVGLGKKRLNRKSAKTNGAGDEQAVEEAEEEGAEQRRLQSDNADEAAQRAAEMDRRREEMRAQKQQEIRDRYKNRESRDRGGDIDPERFMSRGRPGRGGDSEEDYMAARHQEIRDRHRRDRGSSRDRSGRRDRKRPEEDGRHAVLRRRIEKHAHVFTPEELAEIDDDLKEHKKREDKLDAARDKLNAQFDAVRDIDDRDDRLERLEELKEIRAKGRDAERAARDKLREDFQLIREKLEAKLRTEL